MPAGVSAAGGQRRGRRVAFRGAGAGRARGVRPTGVALRTFDEALGLWRGLPYAEFAGEEFATAEVARLVELRARAIEERAAALLELGRPEEVLGELEVEITVRAVSRASAGAADAGARPCREAGRVTARRMTSFVGSWPTRSVWSPRPGLQELNDDIVRQHPDVAWAGSPTKERHTTDLPSGTVSFLFTEVEGSTRPVGRASRRDAGTRCRVTTSCSATRSSHTWLHRQARGRRVPCRVRDRPRCDRGCGCRTTSAARGRMEHRGDRARPDGDPYGRGRGARRRLQRRRGESCRAADVGGARRTDRGVSRDGRVLHDALPEKYGFVDLGEHRLRDLGGRSACFRWPIPIWGGSSRRCVRWTCSPATICRAGRFVRRASS